MLRSPGTAARDGWRPQQCFEARSVLPGRGMMLSSCSQEKREHGSVSRSVVIQSGSVNTLLKPETTNAHQLVREENKLWSILM